MTACPKFASTFLRIGVRGDSGRGSGAGAEITGSFSLIGAVSMVFTEVDVVEMEAASLDRPASLVPCFFDDESAGSCFHLALLRTREILGCLRFCEISIFHFDSNVLGW